MTPGERCCRRSPMKVTPCALQCCMFRRIVPADPPGHGYPQLDGLRAVAFLLVLLVHSVVALQDAGADGTARTITDAIGPLVQMGGTGVHLFFVLSGCLLFLPYARGFVGERAAPRPADFFRRRILRIVPAYYGVLFACLLIYAPADAAKQALSHMFFVHNISTATHGGVNEPLWTLAVEWQFYVLLPAAAVVLARAWQRSPRSAWLLLSLTVPMSLASAASSVAAAHWYPSWSRAHDTVFNTSRFLVVFAAGMTCALLYVLHGKAVTTALTGLAQRYGAWIALSVFAIYGFAGWFGVVPASLDFYGYALAMAVMYGLLLLNLLLTDGGLVRLLSSPAMRMIGNISFSGYLVHKPLIKDVVAPFAVSHGSGAGQVLLLGAGVLLVVLPCALLVYSILERPFLRQRSPHEAPGLSGLKPVPVTESR